MDVLPEPEHEFRRGRPNGAKKEERYLALAKLAVLRAFRVPKSEQAHTFGVAPQTLINWLTRNRKFVDSIEQTTRALIKPEKISFPDLKDVPPEKYVEELQRRLGRSLAVMDRALESGQLTLAFEAMKEVHKVLGFGQKLTVKHEGEVSVTHEVRYVEGPIPAMLDAGAERRAKQTLTVTPIRPALPPSNAPAS